MDRTDGDLVRQLEKVRDTVAMADKHFTAEAEMNAALHMAPTVRPAPLVRGDHGRRDDLDRLIGELKEI
jgi:hypothetical protein